MASKHLRTGRRLCRGLDAAKHSTVLQPSRPLASDTLGPCPSAPEIDASWRSRFTHSWEHLAASRSHGAPSKAPIATALSGSGDPTRCHGPCAGSERFVYAPSPEVGAFLPARKQFSTRTSGDPSEPRLAKNDPRNVPDRPAPPEASTFRTLNSLSYAGWSMAWNELHGMFHCWRMPELLRVCFSPFSLPCVHCQTIDWTSALTAVPSFGVAGPIVEPGQDPLAAGAQKEGYVSLMQQIVGAVKERPVDAAAKSRLEVHFTVAVWWDSTV